MKKLYLLFVAVFYCSWIQTAQESKAVEQIQSSQQLVLSFLPQDRSGKRRLSQPVQVPFLQNMQAVPIPRQHAKATDVQKKNAQTLEQELRDAMENNNIDRVAACLAKERYFRKRQQEENPYHPVQVNNNLQVTLKKELSNFLYRNIKDELDQEWDSRFTGRKYQLRTTKEDSFKRLCFVFEIDAINQGDDKFVGKTLLQKAARDNSFNIMQLLIEGGADVNRSDYQGDTPLFDAVGGNSPRATLLLIEKGADIHHVNKAKTTLLHRAGLYNAGKTAQILIEKGIDVNKVNKWGETPLGLAKAWKADKVISLLEATGAQEKASGDLK